MHSNTASGIPLENMTDEQLVIYLGMIVRQVGLRGSSTMVGKKIEVTATSEHVPLARALHKAAIALTVCAEDISIKEIEIKRRNKTHV